ncbi:nucleoside/nucleotide kinase family protein [Streptomyces zagrosensis]|uniref:Pantothenate kinase n=1 Tax=Streptomyces zagrosensis TaxID=1042984 RepID=A0A7W9Q7P9_9ACTN|nr:nucleoside/nucleotide kinase family protein [Streptomyces zagrosensis]MBB5935149.1 pantothenate kinase [Streptomyces zagrosensis]
MGDLFARTQLPALAADAWALATAHGRSDTPPQVEARPARCVLGIAGAPGAGKSTLARALVAALEERHGAGTAAYLPLDGFHLSHTQLQRLGLTDRKGSAPSFDVWGYAALVHRVSQERQHDVYVPDYDRTLHEPVAARHVVRPTAGLVITEGNYLACDAPGWRDARRSMAAVWYLEAPDEVRETRLVERQLAGGRDAAHARAWVAGNDQPNGEQVKESRRLCDRIVSPVDMDVTKRRG